MGAITLVAFALRVAGIDQWGSLDFDEQASFFIGSMPPTDMLRYLLGAPFEHPPLFYLVFHAWLAAAGSSETAMRLFAVIPGTLAVPLLGLSVARVSDTRTGVVAAAALALSPLHVFHSRDARMYTLLALFTTGMLAAIASGAARRGLIIGGVGLAALVTHYYAVFAVMGVMAGWAWHAGGQGTGARGQGLRATRQRPGTRSPEVSPDPEPPTSDPHHPSPNPRPSTFSRQLWPLVVLGALTAIGALVWLASASGLRTSLTAVSPRAVPAGDLTWALLQTLGAALAGPLASPGLIVVAAATTVGLLVLGWSPLARERGGGPSLAFAWRPFFRTVVGSEGASSLLAAVSWGGFLFTTVGIPLLLLLGRPFAPRFVVLGAPFLAALLALGSRRLGNRTVVLAGAAYVALAAVGLASMYGGYQRSDYGEAMARIRSEVRPDDGVILNGPWQDLLYRRYGVGLPPGRIVASTVPLEADETIGWLRRITAEHPRVWVIDSATDLTDPTGAVADWLDANTYPRPVIEYQKAVLRPYLTDQRGGLTPRPIDVSSLGMRFTSVAMDRWTLAAGQESRLQIEGSAAARGEAASARAVVDLLSPAGSSVWHWDGPLARVGDALTFRAAVLVPPGTPPGSYTMQLTAYEATPLTSRRVTRIGERVVLSSIGVQ